MSKVLFTLGPYDSQLSLAVASHGIVQLMQLAKVR